MFPETTIFKPDWSRFCGETTRTRGPISNQNQYDCKASLPLICYLQGMFIVSFPYSVLEGGYWALVSMVVVAWICCYTGKILIECLYEDDVVMQPGDNDDGGSGGGGERVKRRVRGSYVDVAAAVWGSKVGGRLVFVAQSKPDSLRYKPEIYIYMPCDVEDFCMAIYYTVYKHICCDRGGRLVFLAQLIELLMTCILYVLLCGELMVGVFPTASLDLTAWIIISGFVLLPCALLRSLRRVAWLSFWCTVAHMIVNGVIVVYCFTRLSQWHWRDVHVSHRLARSFPNRFVSLHNVNRLSYLKDTQNSLMLSATTPRVKEVYEAPFFFATSADVGRFQKFFHWHFFYKICNRLKEIAKAKCR